jgi:hypothetical protein
MNVKDVTYPVIVLFVGEDRMLKSSLAKELKRRQYNLGKAPSHIIRALSDDQIIDCYITCSCCGEKWVLKKPCGGRGHCQSPLHMFLFNESPICHTVSFIEPMRFHGDGGRFHSPYRTWQMLKDAEMERCVQG